MGLLSQLAPLLGTHRNALSGAPRSTRFAAALRQHEDERHGRIVALPSPERYPSSLPPGWRAEDILGKTDGFLPLREAAKTMAVSEARVVEMVRAGLLEADGSKVRPAIVSVLAVKDERG